MALILPMNINYIYCGTVHGILTADGNSRTVCALLAYKDSCYNICADELCIVNIIRIVDNILHFVMQPFSYQSLGLTHSAWAVISTRSLFDSLSTR